MENRIPKNRYNGSDDRHTYEKSAADRERDRLKKLEAEMDKRAADVALTITDMFKFMSMSAAILPNMELDADIFHLKINDGGIFFKITYPEIRKRGVCNCRKNKSDDDDEEGLLYDGN